VQDGFSQEELDRAKSGMRRQREQARAQDDNISDSWVTLLENERDFAWHHQHDEQIAALTLAQLNDAMRRHIVPSRMSVVTARDEMKAKALTP